MKRTQTRKLRITKREKILESGKKATRIYAIEMIDGDYTERVTSYFTKEDSVIRHLRSTAREYNNDNVEYLDGKVNIYLNTDTYVIDNGKTYSLYYKGEHKKNFRQWHKVHEYMTSGNLR